MDMSELRSGWAFMCLMTVMAVFCFVAHARGTSWIVVGILFFIICIPACVIMDSLSFVKFPEKPGEQDKKEIP